MKKAIVVAIILNALAGMSLAQPPGKGRMGERVEAFRVAFITERLNLKPDEAQKFWPVFNQYRDALKDLRASYAPKKPVEDMTDQDAEQFLTATLELEQKEINLKKDYYQRLKAVIPPKKIARLGKVERDFKEAILNKAKDWRQNMRDERMKRLDEN